ncbi:hypothetical protein Pmani_013844 [Petrolisthes manimaculis]|uniref:Uncharacterized protein n=1 Tax=Petrolisthes manimaculis TaxID=1843537 RepID=A0AAE1UD78_9EUCA|nr:hypothetical protein Pmani_013844 [Petrolisthes manimaculis]
MEVHSSTAGAVGQQRQVSWWWWWWDSCSVQLIGKYHHGGHIIDSVAPIAANWPAVGYGATWGAGSIISPRPIADVAMTIQHLIGALYPAGVTSLVP